MVLVPSEGRAQCAAASPSEYVRLGKGDRQQARGSAGMTRAAERRTDSKVDMYSFDLATLPFVRVVAAPGTRCFKRALQRAEQTGSCQLLHAQNGAMG